LSQTPDVLTSAQVQMWARAGLAADALAALALRCAAVGALDVERGQGRLVQSEYLIPCALLITVHVPKRARGWP
jgi:hypothetical protein